MGDVLAGSLTLNPASPFYNRLQQAWARLKADQQAPPELWGGDAIVLEKNSRDYCQRIQHINRNAEQLFEFLAAHQEIENIWFPKCQTPHLPRFPLGEEGYYNLMPLFISSLVERPNRSLQCFVGPTFAGH